jgi:hypothetical protein
VSRPPLPVCAITTHSSFALNPGLHPSMASTHPPTRHPSAAPVFTWAVVASCSASATSREMDLPTASVSHMPLRVPTSPASL